MSNEFDYISDDYIKTISLIRRINTLYSHDRLVPTCEARDIGIIVEEFSHMDNMRKSMLFEYLLFTIIGRMDR